MSRSSRTSPAAPDVQPPPAPPAERDPPDDSLVPVRPRADGWTAEKQQAFIAHLADHGSVKAACASVKMSEQSAYQLRRRPGAAAFRAAWGEAVRIEIERIADTVVDRAVNGDVRQRWYKDELVGEERVYSDRLQLWLIRNGMDVLDRLDAARAADAGLPVHETVAPLELRVWQCGEDGQLRTNAPVPPGWEAYELDARFSYGDPDFRRYLTDEEREAWLSRDDVQGADAAAEQARLALFNLAEA